VETGRSNTRNIQIWHHLWRKTVAKGMMFWSWCCCCCSWWWYILS
jgi:hypothetical protein